MSVEEEKVVIRMIPKLDDSLVIKEIRANEATVTIEDGMLEYNLKIDYDYESNIENLGVAILAYKKYERGSIHMKDVVGIWRSSTTQYLLKEDSASIEEKFNHTIEIATIGEPLQFGVEHKDLKPIYDQLKEQFDKYKKGL